MLKGKQKRKGKLQCQRRKENPEKVLYNDTGKNRQTLYSPETEKRYFCVMERLYWPRYMQKCAQERDLLGSLQGKPGDIPWSLCCCVSLPIKWKKWTKVSQIFVSGAKWISLCIYQVLCIGQRTHTAFTKGIPNCLH